MRHYIYAHISDTTRPPSAEETALHFKITAKEAGEYYTELSARHAIFLEPGTLTIRMANPFSGIPTDFKVHANGRTYYANCAWDMLGIPAALHCDVVINAVFSESNEPVQINVTNGKITNGGLLVHFPLPFARWYDDLVYT